MSDRRYSDRSDRRYSNRTNGYQGRQQRDRRGKGKFNKYQKGSREFSLPQGTVVYILDILEHGHVDRQQRNSTPIVQAIETPGFNLYEMYYNKSQELKVQEKVILTKDSGSKVGKVKRKLKYHGLTRTSKELLQSTIELHLDDREDLYVTFLNKAESITTKRHQLNLLPGVGQKLMWEIINQRQKKPFESYKDFEDRTSIKNVKGLIAKRILNEIIDDEEKHYLFVKRRPSGKDDSRERDRSSSPRSSQRRY